MSRIGKQPIEVPSGVTIEISKDEIKVKGPKGELQRSIHPSITVEQKDNIVTVTRASDSKEDRSLHGLFRSLISNMVEGVSKGYEKKLEVIGVGYRFQAKGTKITLSLGFSHPVEFEAKSGITLEADPENKQILVVKGIDKELVGETAAKIRSYRPPEPYKGKGVRYVDEYVARKSGKAAGGSGGDS